MSIEGKVLTKHSFWEGGWQFHKKAQRVNLKNYQHYRIAQFFDRHLPDSPLLAMEVGAGNSIWLPYMIEKYNYSVVGMDYSKTGCELLKVNLQPNSHLSYLVIEADMFHYCFRPYTFDVIFSNGLIEHFTDYPTLIGLFKKWLKPGGFLVTFVPNKQHFFRYIEKKLAPEVYDAHMLLSPADLLTAYQKQGMKDIQTGYLGSFFTWKYNSYARGLKRPLLLGLSRILNLSVHTLLRTSGFEPESQAFSPHVYALGRS